MNSYQEESSSRRKRLTLRPLSETHKLLSSKGSNLLAKLTKRARFNARKPLL
jgi:hypothetical protein